jgi:hypothetical protein
VAQAARDARSVEVTEVAEAEGSENPSQSEGRSDEQPDGLPSEEEAHDGKHSRVNEELRGCPPIIAHSSNCA